MEYVLKYITSIVELNIFWFSLSCTRLHQSIELLSPLWPYLFMYSNKEGNAWKFIKKFTDKYTYCTYTYLLTEI